jgi:phosphoesterase RecJ-like protein
MLKKITETIKKANSFIIVSHLDPDGDTMGSMIALGEILEIMGKKVTLFCQDPVPDIYHFLPHASKVKTEIPSTQKYDLGIVVDAGSIKRVGRGIEALLQAKQVINIDHHSDNTLYGDINLVQSVSSVAEIIFELAESLKVKLTPSIAQCLMAALMTDTGTFRYDNTTVRTLEIAVSLTRSGAVPSQIAKEVYESKPLSAMQLMAKALSNAKTSKNGRLIWTFVSRSSMNKMGARDQDAMGIVDVLRSIKGVEVAVVIREYRVGKVKVNLRSKTNINVSRIAKKLGGGGHPRAAGAILEGKPADLIEKIVKTIEDNFRA